MRVLYSSLLNLIKHVTLIAIFAYPLTFIIQLFTGNDLFSEYNLFVLMLIKNYGSWILLIAATLIVAQSNENQLALMEKIREQHYLLEVERWSATSYISPTHLYYLFSPPTAVTSDQKSNAYDPFYIKVVNDFRNRIYSNIIPSRPIPSHRPNILQIAGKSIIVSMIECLLTVALVIIAIDLFDIPYMNSWYNLILFFFIYPILKVSDIILAFYYIQPSSIYKKIERQFNLSEPRISWAELNHSTAYGQTILLAWKMDSDRRQRDHNQLTSRSQQNMQYSSPGVATYPYPKRESFSPIVENFDLQDENVITLPAIHTVKNNVVPFKKKSKKVW